MIFLTQDLASLQPYNKDAISLYSRCGVGDLLILRDYVMPKSGAKCFDKCPHCGSLTGPGDTPLFRGNKKYLHIRLLKGALDTRVGQIPHYLQGFLMPFLEKLFPANCTIFVSLALNPHRRQHGDFIGNGIYYEGFAGTPNVLASQVFPKLAHQNLSSEIFDRINVTQEMIDLVRQGEYICIHTRYRSASRPDPDFFRSLIFDVIGSTKQKICLVGEKSNSCEFYSVYNICKNSIPKDRLVDFTSQNLSINTLATDCYLSKHSKLCLAFGIGGNIVMNSYAKVPTHTFVDLGHGHPFLSKNKFIKTYNNKYTFMLKISRLLNSL